MSRPPREAVAAALQMSDEGRAGAMAGRVLAAEVRALRAELEARTPDPERCGDTAKGLFSQVFVCAQAAGHRLPHRDEAGTAWGPLELGSL